MKLKKALSVLLATIVMFTLSIPTGLIAEATLLPIQTYEANAILDDYTTAELSNFTISDLLDELEYADSGEKIEIDPSAVIMWASNDLNPNDEFNHRIGYDYYTLANKNTRIPIALGVETNYEIVLNLIVGSGKQLDPDNVCYNVTVSYTRPYIASDAYKIYTLVDGVKTELEIIKADCYSTVTLLHINEPINEDTPIYIEYCGKLVKTSNGEEVDADMTVDFEFMEKDENGWLTDSTVYPRFANANISWTSDGETLLELVRYISIYSESSASSVQDNNSNSIGTDSVDISDSPYEYNADFYIHSVYPYPLDNYDKIDCFSTKENNTTYIREYDKCTIDGHQTFFITKKDGSDIDMSSIMLELDAKITSLQVYNETEGKMTDVCTEPQDFSKNNTIHYSFTNSKGQKKHYWITVNAVNEGGAKLFVDGPSERTVYFNACYGWTHNILIANTGDEPLTGLSVKLTDAKNIKLDEYWTVGGTKNDTLAPFTTSDINKMANLANIRLLPNGNDGEIGGTLTIKADGQKDVVIKLSGKAGNPGLTIGEELEAVKYVPYSVKLEIDNPFAWNEFVSRTLYGDLPEGMTYNESTGEIYGVPMEAGTFDLNVMLVFSVTGYHNQSIKLEVKDNTEKNIRNVTSNGYGIISAIGEKSYKHYCYFLALPEEDELFVSKGEYSEFTDLWLNGQKLQLGTDYTVEEGYTRITVSKDILQGLEIDSVNTIVAEFREGGKPDGALKCTAQNFTIVEEITSNLLYDFSPSYEPTGDPIPASVLATIKGTSVKTDVLNNYTDSYAVFVGTQFAGQFANLYKYESPNLVFKETVKVDKDGIARFSAAEAGTYAVYTDNSTHIKGDMNNSMGIDAVDASLILRWITGFVTFDDPMKADIDGNGTVTVIDASYILQLIVGLI